MWWFFFSARMGYYQNRSKMKYKFFLKEFCVRVYLSSTNNGNLFSVIRNKVRGDYRKSIRSRYGSSSRRNLKYGGMGKIKLNQETVTGGNYT
jgi:hypothetical protein